jgi:hypothetical protein
MDFGTLWDRSSPVGRFIRLALYTAILFGLLVGGLLLVEGGGSTPVRPLGGQHISSNQPAGSGGPQDVTPTTEKSNGGCKHQPNPPPNCRPPSGN